MTPFTPALASVAAGMSQAQRTAAVGRDDRKRPASSESKKRVSEGELLDLQTAQAADGVRSLKGNADQETAEDRSEQDHYATPKQNDALKHPHPPRPRIDLKG